MKWIAVSGSWRLSSPEIDQDVRSTVSDIMNRGDGIVTGGALGVDYTATEQALVLSPDADKIRIILPTPLDIYAAHYRKRAQEGVITTDQAEALIDQLTTVRVRNPQSLIQMGHTVLCPKTYYDRNTKVLDLADGLVAFQVNGSQGVQDTVDKARARDMTILHRVYTVNE